MDDCNCHKLCSTTDRCEYSCCCLSLICEQTTFVSAAGFVRHIVDIHLLVDVTYVVINLDVQLVGAINAINDIGNIKRQMDVHNMSHKPSSSKITAELALLRDLSNVM